MATIYRAENGLTKRLSEIREEKNNKTSNHAFIFLLIGILSAGFSFRPAFELLEFLPFVANNAFIIISLLRYVIPTCLIVAFIVVFSHNAAKNDEEQIIEHGLNAETTALAFLSSYLPKNYAIFTNVRVPYQDGESETDILVVTPSARLFVVEIKGYVGNLSGDWNDLHLLHTNKKGTFSKDEYNPVKQISKHIFRLSRYIRSNSCQAWVNGCVYFTDPQLKLDVYGVPANDCRIFDQGNKDELITYLLEDKDQQHPDMQQKLVETLKTLL